MISAINAVTKYLLLARCEANFLRAKKKSLEAKEVNFLGDFDENCQLLVQDEIQSYHWSKEYCTLHTLIYFINSNRNIQHNSLCFISDDNNHNSNFVHKIQTILVDYNKENLPIVDKIFYFSDDCAEQYKYHKNFINLCHHQQDYSMNADWIFFATSHGKSPCDSVGGFVKPYVTKNSLQRPLHDQILSYQSPLDLCVNKISPITFFGVSQEEMVNVCTKLEDPCFRTMPETRSSHHFVPISCNKIAHKLTNEGREFLQFDFEKSLTEEIDIKNIKSFLYVSCIYNTFWWVGIVPSFLQGWNPPFSEGLNCSPPFLGIPPLSEANLNSYPVFLRAIQIGACRLYETLK